jgi:hypothetical protein
VGGTQEARKRGKETVGETEGQGEKERQRETVGETKRDRGSEKEMTEMKSMCVCVRKIK